MEESWNARRAHTLVTGCSSGIGRATALRLAAAGQHVYAGIRNPDDGEQLARCATGGELTPLILDVTDPSHIAAAAGVVAGSPPAPAAARRHGPQRILDDAVDLVLDPLRPGQPAAADEEALREPVVGIAAYVELGCHAHVLAGERGLPAAR